MLTEVEVESIRRLVAQGRSVSRIAADLGLPYNTVWRAAKGYTFAGSFKESPKEESSPIEEAAVADSIERLKSLGVEVPKAGNESDK